MKETRDQYKKRILKEFYGFSKDTDYGEVMSRRNLKRNILDSIEVYSLYSKCDLELNFVDSIIREYALIDLKEDNLYAKETVILTQIIRNLDRDVAYCEKLLTDSEKRYNNAVNELRKLPESERKEKEMAYVWKMEIAVSVFTSIAINKIFFDSLVFGGLDENLCPKGEVLEFDSENGNLQLPVFTHDPCETDISNYQLEKNDFYKALSTIANLYPDCIRGLFKDCSDGALINDGNAFVRLYNVEEGKYEIFKIQKSDAYLRNIIQEDGECIWTGLLVLALEEMGLSLTRSKPETLLGAIFGPVEKLPDYGKLVSGELKKDFNDPKLIKMSASYRRCLKDMYYRIVATSSLLARDVDEYDALLSAIKEGIGVSFSGEVESYQEFYDAAKLIKLMSDRYRESPDAKTPEAAKRLAVCDAADKLFEYVQNEEFRAEPYLKYQWDYTIKLAKAYLTGRRLELSENNIKNCHASLLQDKNYRRIISKMNIVDLCEASNETILNTLKQLLTSTK